MTDSRTPERFWTIKGLKQRVVGLGGVGVYLWGMHQQEKIDDEKYDSSLVSHQYRTIDDDMNWKEKVCTPVEWAEFRKQMGDKIL